jgi:hypothetical protein
MRPDERKWRFYCAELSALDEDELTLRRDAFMEMWHGMLPLVVREVHMTYEDFKDTV